MSPEDARRLEAVFVRVGVIEEEIKSLRHDRHDTLGRMAAIEVLLKESRREREEDRQRLTEFRDELTKQLTEATVELSGKISARDGLFKYAGMFLVGLAAVLVAVFH